MKKLDTSKQITRFVMFLFFAYACSLTLPLFAQLAVDDHPPNKRDRNQNVIFNVSASAVLDDLWYDSSGLGFVNLSGNMTIFNLDRHRSYGYYGDYRLDIRKHVREDRFDPLHPDARYDLLPGTVPKFTDGTDNLLTFPKTINLQVDCTGAQEDVQYTMFANVTLNLTLNNRTESWKIQEYKKNFWHTPEGVDGIGPTDEAGENFIDACDANAGEEWHSLLITDATYDEVLWYVHEPGDNSIAGTYIEVDSGGAGNLTNATMTYRFPADITKNAYFKIRAEIWRNDGTGYEEFYQVWVWKKPKQQR